ncbi:MAG: carboxypeptidase-like regulatory domain-containing protein [Bacteroidetes bacterium]|jgi:hypothetical protein|nr:carboxypeptidase-like regulatory domain-containing protein [Bacteroidota bacterium]
MSFARNLFILLLLCFAVNIYAQDRYTISGVVKDNNGQTLPGATVFLTNTKIITACNASGEFSLSNVSSGTYQLVAKMIGFAPEILPLTLNNSNLSFAIILKPRANQLNEVNISFDPDWDRHYAEFKSHFLGKTPNAADCKILNPKVLHFHYSKRLKKFTASADDFIQIENDALGYKINYLLSNFEYSDSTHVMQYADSPSFEELKAKSDKQLKQWEKNRAVAYNGSVTHLMKSIYDGDVVKEGFEVFKIIGKPPVGSRYEQDKPIFFDNRPVLFDSLLTVTDKNFKSLTYKDCLFVIYTNEKEVYQFKDSGYKISIPKGAKVPNGQCSMVNLMEPNVTLDANGNFSSPNALLFEGYMAWEQVADLMPLEYGTEK